MQLKCSLYFSNVHDIKPTIANIVHTTITMYNEYSIVNSNDAELQIKYFFLNKCPFIIN